MRYALSKVFKDLRDNLDEVDVEELFGDFESLIQTYFEMLASFYKGEFESKKEVVELVIDIFICAVDPEYIPDWMVNGGTDEQS